MKVVLLAPANSVHTVQWAKYLSEAGVEIVVISQHCISQDMPSHIPVYLLPFGTLLGYFLNIYKVRSILENIKPDIVHVHYASGYGTIAQLVNFHPYILSVWGSDVYDFPYRSKIHHWLIRRNLYIADKLSSTSCCMMEQTLRIAPRLKAFDVVPFGVDFEKFAKIENNKVSFQEKNTIVIGTVKTLSEKYGIDLLIKSFVLLRKKIAVSSPEVADKLRLRIVGKGVQERELKLLTKQLGIERVTSFIGEVSHNHVPNELRKLDIYVALSRYESFGVAVIEAEAIGLPVVVSDVGGWPEVVIDKYTGFIVPKENIEKAVEVLEILVMDSDLRNLMGHRARQFIQENFSWEKCVQKMVSLYNLQISKRKKVI